MRIAYSSWIGYSAGTMKESSAVLDLLRHPVRKVPVAVLDLEMTGLDASRDRICEVAVVRGEDAVCVLEFQSLVRPGVKVSAGALRVHGLQDSALVGAPSFEALADSIARIVEGAVIVGHNVAHDLEFLHRAFELAGRSLPPPISVDTLLISRRIFAFPKNNLPTVCAMLSVNASSFHRAMADARATWAVWNRMLEILDPQGQVTVGEILEWIGALAPNSPLRLHQQRLLREAFRSQRTVIIDYASHEAAAIGACRREISIWRLKLPYVQAWCFLREGERVFRFDRIRSVEPGVRLAEVPQTFQARI